MNPGIYVVRMPCRGMGNRLIVESRAFRDRQDGQNWLDFIQSQHPKDDVFLIERPANH